MLTIRLLYPIYPIPLLFTLTVPQLAAFIKHFPTNERLRTLFLSLFSYCFYMWMAPCLVNIFYETKCLVDIALLSTPPLFMGSAKVRLVLLLFFTVIFFFFCLLWISFATHLLLFLRSVPPLFHLWKNYLLIWDFSLLL